MIIKNWYDIFNSKELVFFDINCFPDFVVFTSFFEITILPVYNIDHKMFKEVLPSKMSYKPFLDNPVTQETINNIGRSVNSVLNQCMKDGSMIEYRKEFIKLDIEDLIRDNPNIRKDLL